MTNPCELSPIYLDANATTPVLPAAANAALSAMKDLYGNPSSGHITGLKAKDVMEQTRISIKKYLGVGDGTVIFTSGATEGIQTAILSALVAAKENLQANRTYSLLYGATEHKAVPESLKHWNKILGIHAEIKAIPVDKQGNLDLDFIRCEAANALMICTMAVNNETGVYQDLSKLEQCIRGGNADVFWMVDCVQALGKLPLNLATTSIDYAPFSGHKLYGPKGIGFVYIRKGAAFTPFIAGGGQEGGLRSGTENLPGLAALQVIFQMLNNEALEHFASQAQLYTYRDQLVAALTKAFPTLVFNHDFANCVATTINFAIPGFSSKEIMDLFDAAGMRVSSGSACGSKVSRSFVLDAMGLPHWQSESAIRLSFGPAMTAEQVQQACERIELAAQALSSSCLVLSADTVQTTQKVNGLFQFKSAGSCCWLYVDDEHKTAVVIDPLPELVERITTLLKCQKLQPVAILDTHGHGDHTTGRDLLAERFLPDQVSDDLGWPITSSLQLTAQNQNLRYLVLGKHWLILVPTPGHTGDSVSYILSRALNNGDSIRDKALYGFCGDTLLMGSLGRTNFNSSSAPELYHSIQTLNRLLSDNTLICPSHDYHNEFTTTLLSESQRNKLLHQVLSGDLSEADFCVLKQQLDSHLDDQSASEIMCGAYVAPKSCSPIQEYDDDSLKQVLAKDTTVKLIDIRESHEYALQHSVSADLNVPMTRLVQFIGEHMQDREQPWVLLCRSGGRSLVVAQALARLGFNHIGHLKGGYALGKSL
ncbi:MAG: cysteine desulfurase [Paraglaciecola sp.]|jgi:cysteine desulfurase